GRGRGPVPARESDLRPFTRARASARPTGPRHAGGATARRPGPSHRCLAGETGLVAVCPAAGRCGPTQRRGPPLTAAGPNDELLAVGVERGTVETAPDVDVDEAGFLQERSNVPRIQIGQ